jgi:hypothetical protein
LAEQKLERLDAIFRQSIHARGNRTNGERVSRRDFGFDFSSAKYLTRAQDPKDAIEDTPVIYTRHTGLFVSNGLNGGPFIVGSTYRMIQVSRWGVRITIPGPASIPNALI